MSPYKKPNPKTFSTYGLKQTTLVSKEKRDIGTTCSNQRKIHHEKMKERREIKKRTYEKWEEYWGKRKQLYRNETSTKNNASIITGGKSIDQIEDCVRENWEKLTWRSHLDRTHVTWQTKHQLIMNTSNTKQQETVFLSSLIWRRTRTDGQLMSRKNSKTVIIEYDDPRVCSTFITSIYGK